MALAAPPSLRDELKKRYANPFTAGTQENIGAAMNSTFSNLRGLPPGPATPAGAAPAPGFGSPAPLQTPPVDLSAGPGNVFATPGVNPASMSAAAGLMNAQQQGQLAGYQTQLRDRLVNTDPTNQAPGDLAQSLKIAEDQFNIAFGGPNPGVSGVGGPSSASGLPKGVTSSTFAPIGSGAAALAAGGAPVTGYGGTQVTGIAAPGNPFSTPATPPAAAGGFVPGAGSGMAAPTNPGTLPVWQQNQMPGNRFTLTQNPNTVPGAPGYIPPAAPPPLPSVSGAPISQGVPFAAGRTPFQQASGAVQSGGVQTYPNAAAVEQHYPADKYDYSMTPGPGGAVAVKSVSPRAPAKSTLGPDYEPDPNKPGAVRPIEGSKTWVDREEKKQTFQRRMEHHQESAKNVIANIDTALANANGITTGAGGKALSVIWGTDAYDQKQVLETIKANIGFDRLQQMREESPTGGALGQVAVQELVALQNSFRSLEQGQSPARFRENLKALRNHYERYIAAESGTDPRQAPEGVNPKVWAKLTPEQRSLWDNQDKKK